MQAAIDQAAPEARISILVADAFNWLLCSGSEAIDTAIDLQDEPRARQGRESRKFCGIGRGPHDPRAASWRRPVWVLLPVNIGNSHWVGSYTLFIF